MDAGAGRCGFEHDNRPAVLRHDVVRDCRAFEGDLNHVASSFDRTLPDGVGHGIRLAHANADATLFVSNHHYGVEAQVASALDNLGDARYADDPLYEMLLVRVFVLVAHLGSLLVALLRPLLVTLLVTLLRSLRVVSLLRSIISGHLENQTPFAGGVCQCLCPAVILEPTPIEDDALHALLGRALGYQRPDHRRDLRLWSAVV